MISAFANTWKIPELRRRILFTLAIILVVRLGVHLPIPGVNTNVIDEWLKWQVNTGGQKGAGNALGAMLTVFSGGGLQNCGIFALGIMPYISASIMMQLLTAVVPQLTKLAREDGGRQKITQYTRFATIAIAIFQSFLLARTLLDPNSIPYLEGIHKFGELVPDKGAGFLAMTTLVVTCGTMFLMWLGDQITEKGLGNGTSLIIAVNIVSALPGAMAQAWRSMIYSPNGTVDGTKALLLVALLLFLIFVIAAVITITQAQRKVVIQYAKRIVGNKMFGGQTQYLPMKLNYAGVMPIIFASAVLSLPSLLLQQLFKNSEWVHTLTNYLSPSSWVYFVVTSLMIFGFSFFWVATMFQPNQIAEDLKKNGGYVPGIRPGKPTATFLESTMVRLTFAGSIALTAIYFIPYIVQAVFNISPVVCQFFGGTSLLILVGVLLDMMRQTETQLLQRHYEGFLRKGKVRGRYDRLQGTGAAASSAGLIRLWIVLGLVILAGAIVITVNHGR